MASSKAKFILCPLRCENNLVPRGELQSHILNNCTAIDGTCPYKQTGCNFKGSTDLLKKHLNDKKDEHMFWFLVNHKQLGEELSGSQQEIAELKNKIESIVQEKEEENRTLKNCIKKQSEEIDELRSFVMNFKKKFDQYVAIQNMTVQNTANQNMTVQNSTNQDMTVQNSTNQNQNSTTVNKTNTNSTADILYLISSVFTSERIDSLCSVISNIVTLYDKYDQESTKREQINESTSLQHTLRSDLNWRINDVKNKMNKPNHQQLSPSFITPEGYRLQIIVHLNGVGNSTGICFYVQVLNGYKDDTLSWPLKGALKVKLYNPENPDKSIYYFGNVSDNRKLLTKRVSRVPPVSCVHKIASHCDVAQEDLVFYEDSEQSCMDIIVEVMPDPIA